MKVIYYILLILAFGCQRQGNLSLPNSQAEDFAPLKKVDNTRFHIKEDSIQLVFGEYDTLVFRKQVFNEIIDKHPEFFFSSPLNLDDAYRLNGSDFGSEVGQDTYCQLYAYFLSQKNISKEVMVNKERLTKIYNTINEIYWYIQHGGTFFVHKYRRIPAFVEFTLFMNSLNDNAEINPYFIKVKHTYIKSLRESVVQGVNLNDEFLESERPERKKEINVVVNELDSLITNIQYLRQAQKFHYSYYDAFEY